MMNSSTAQRADVPRRSDTIHVAAEGGRLFRDSTRNRKVYDAAGKSVKAAIFQAENVPDRTGWTASDRGSSVKYVS